MTNDALWQTGLKALNCHPDETQLAQLNKYLNLLNRWNKTYNLTAIRDPKQMIPLHIFDSLAVAEFIQGKNCLDVGSGGGLPTIPLAIMQAERQFTALDTNGKKTRFIQQAVIELGLKNVEVVQTRIENWKTDQRFDAIISRAFSSIEDFVSSSSAYLAKSGILYAMKGQFPIAELESLPNNFKVVEQHSLDVPYVEGERHLLEIKLLD